jgi:hypothetical protein
MTIQIYSKAALAKSREKAQFPANLRLQDHMREVGSQGNGHRVYEFMGTDSFGAQWSTRQRYEIDAGRDEEPVVYTPIYDIVADTSLPKNVSVNTMGPGGVVFEEVFEGGEVKFSGIAGGQYTVPIRHWATGLEYSKDLVIFNEFWSVPVFERQMGVAHNALLNHLHLSPFIVYTTTPAYPASNKTAAVTGTQGIADSYLLTIEAAIAHASADTTNPRRGPYTLLVATANSFSFERALQPVAQQGISRQSPSLLSGIRSVIAYDGWTGIRGAKTVTYPGVATNKAYLISQQYRGQDAISFEKQSLQNEGNQVDISRFLTQSVWDSYYGVYCNPLRMAEEITLPTS